MTETMSDVAARVEALRPAFAALLASDGWLSESCATPDYACGGRKYITSAEAADLIALNESIAKMLRRWQSTLEVGPRTKDRL